MILLHNVVEILDLADGDRGAMFFIVALDGRFIGGTSIDSDLLWHAVATDRLGQKAFGGLLVALLRQEEINGLALLIHRTVEIPPLALHLDIRLIHAPADPDLPFAAMERLFEEGTILDDPPVDGRVIHLHPTFFHEFLDMACAQRIRHIPPHPHENDLCGEMGTLKTDRHRRSPSCITVGHRGRSYCKSPQMKICDKTPASPCSLERTFAPVEAHSHARWWGTRRS